MFATIKQTNFNDYKSSIQLIWHKHQTEKPNKKCCTLLYEKPKLQTILKTENFQDERRKPAKSLLKCTLWKMTTFTTIKDSAIFKPCVNT